MPSVSPATLARRLRDLAEAVGWGRAWLVGSRWLLHRRYGVYASDLSRPQPRPVMLPGLRVGVLDDREEALVAAVDPGLTPAEVRRRRAEGQRCVLGWWRDTLAHCRWESERPAHLPYLGRVLRPLPGDQVLIDVFTAPPFRGHGIASAVMLVAMERARQAGCTRLLWLAASWNAGSTGMRSKVDRADRVGAVDRWGMGPLSRFAASGSARFDADGCLVVDRAAGEAAPEPGARLLPDHDETRAPCPALSTRPSPDRAAGDRPELRAAGSGAHVKRRPA